MGGGGGRGMRRGQEGGRAKGERDEKGGEG